MTVGWLLNDYFFKYVSFHPHVDVFVESFVKMGVECLGLVRLAKVLKWLGVKVSLRHRRFDKRE